MTAIFDISMSLDGFIAAPNDRPGEELGDGGQRLHQWVNDSAGDRDRDVLAEMWDGAGAVTSGARTFDVCFERWGGAPPAALPWFALSQNKPDRLARGAKAFAFVTDAQCLQAGRVDELQPHVAPVLLGAGIRLFEGIEADRVELTPTRVIETPPRRTCGSASPHTGDGRPAAGRELVIAPRAPGDIPLTPTMGTIGQFEGAPGADLVASGLEDLAAGRETIESLLVCMGSTRLRSVGIDVPPVPIERPSHRLYDLLARTEARTAHGRFNALAARLASFARAAEHARAG